MGHGNSGATLTRPRTLIETAHQLMWMSAVDVEKSGLTDRRAGSSVFSE
jgi:hypothetical protein